MDMKTYSENFAKPTDFGVLQGALKMVDEHQNPLPGSVGGTQMLELSDNTLYAGCSCTACAACAACVACLACLSCLACLFPPLLVEVTAAASASAIATATAAAAGIAVGGAVEATK